MYVLLNEAAQEVRSALLLNVNCPPSLLGSVLSAGSFTVRDRYCAAINLSTPIAAIERALQDPAVQVSKAASLHPFLSVADETYSRLSSAG